MYDKIALGIVCAIVLMLVWQQYNKPVEEPEALTPGEVWGYMKVAPGAIASRASATFSNTLQRRMGMGGAGAGSEKYATNSYVGTFDNITDRMDMRQHFTSGDIATGTMEEGYDHRIILPG